MGDKDFFLSPDDAMTMGDIDYMRTSKRTRRTFPKTLANKGGFALENEVSSVEERNNRYKGSDTNQNTTVNTVFNPTPSTASQPGVTGGSAVTQTEYVQPTPEAAPQPSFDAPKPATEKRRPADDSMDMFRNMAKNMRGRR
ncbi:MAG: hypothetical protein AAFR77_09925 [Cyanobacteria bacterium J06631_2]